MGLTALVISKIKFRIHFLTTNKKWWMFLLAITALLLIRNLLLPKTSWTLHRPKTILIFNNRNLCQSNPRMLIHSRNRSGVRLSAKDNYRSMVIVVLSRRGNFMNRNLVRQTYGSIRRINNINIVSLVFMLGNKDAPGDLEVEHSELEAENLQYGDLVMGDFVDSYRNLTRKTIMAYEWVTTFCCDAQLVMKTDDDVVVNIFKLTEELDALSATEIKSSNIWCRVQYNETYITNENSQFYVPPNVFPDAFFPPHCRGAGYVTPMRVIDRIVNEISKSFVEHVCTHEDVFMTAIVPQKINSNLKSDGQCGDFIELIDKSMDWVTYALERLRGDNSTLILKLLEQLTNDAIDFAEFRKQFEKNVFYLLRHNTEFEERYVRLWEIIEIAFKNKTRN